MSTESSGASRHLSGPLLVVDPNVLISAAITGRGPTLQLIQAAATGSLTLAVSPLLLRELRTTLERPKFRKYLSLDEAAEFVDALQLLAVVTDDPPAAGLAQVCRDPGDDYLVYLAEEVEASFLVSGDKDLLELDRPGLDVRTPAQAVEALEYKHRWGPGLVPGGDPAAAVAQAEAEGHLAVLRAVSAFMLVLEEPDAAELLPLIVTPESVGSWRAQLGSVPALVQGRGLASRPDYPAPDVALVKLPPDPGEHIKATRSMTLPAEAIVVTLQRRPELPEAADFGGWRIHAITQGMPTSEQVAQLRRSLG